MCLCSAHGVLQLNVPICFNLSASPPCSPGASTCETWPLWESARRCSHGALSRSPASPPTPVSRRPPACLLPCVLCCLLDAGSSGAGPAPDECLAPDRTQLLAVFSSVRQKERDVRQRHMGSEEPMPAKRASARGHRCGSKPEPPSGKGGAGGGLLLPAEDTSTPLCKDALPREHVPDGRDEQPPDNPPSSTPRGQMPV